MAKKKQVTAKVEARKSVENRCDYARLNGKCGRAMCENFGKICPGRSCEDWKCDAEGGAVTVVVPKGAAIYKDRVSEAYGRVESAKDNLLRECVKFGALLTEVEDFLGNEQRREGSGLKGWLEENCPEVNYNTALGYKAMAAKCVRMIGGGSQAVAVLQDKTEVIPPGEDAPIEVESKFMEKRDELFSEVKSRRELEQTYFNFMAREGRPKGGRPKAEEKPLPKLKKSDEAKSIWNVLLQQVTKTSVKDAIPLLPEKETQIAYDTVRDLADMLKKHLAEFSK